MVALAILAAGTSLSSLIAYRAANQARANAERAAAATREAQERFVTALGSAAFGHVREDPRLALALAAEAIARARDKAPAYDTRAAIIAARQTLAHGQVFVLGSPIPAGDALAIAVLEARGFTEEDFARSHPGGSLGRRLLLRVRDIMHSGERIPIVPIDASIKQALLEITNKGLGMTAITDGDNHLAGIYTDGDLRRTLDSHADIQSALIRDHMTADCVTISADQIASAALTLMDDKKINALIVTDQQGQIQGALNMHDLLRAGIV